MQELLEQARKLGEMLAASPRVAAFVAAREAVDADPAAGRLLGEFAAQSERIRRLELERKPIEVADKHKLADLERQIAGHEALKRLMRAQADYVDLMNRVHRAMEEPMSQTEPPDSAR